MKKFLKIMLRLFLICSVSFLFLSISLVLLFRYVSPPATPLMVTRLTAQIFHGELPKLKNKWVPLDEISPSMQLAAMCAEDQKFLDHDGFDFDAIEKAVRYNETHRNKRGASTISQQTAKNLFLWPSRDWVRKGLEAYFTVLIENLWSKERIMEVYLNIIETGNGIYGVESASNQYYNKNASRLSREESASIASVLPNPLQRSCVKPDSRTRNRQYWILRQMSRCAGEISYE